MTSSTLPSTIATLWDISVPVANGMVCWPGDPGVCVERVMDVACGDGATVSHLKLGAHTGTHVDAFNHFLKGGQPLCQMELSVYVGPCVVVDAGDASVITAEVLSVFDWAQATRVLFKTANSTQPWWNLPFNEDFVHIAPCAAAMLVEAGVTLVGIDYLSVEGYHASQLYGGHAPTHHRLMEAGVYIVEGLNLCDVEAGHYELTCLPLNITGADGAPARAILRPLPMEAHEPWKL